MKTLLVYPEFPDTYWSFRHALSFEGKRSAFPPLGLLTISAMLPDAWERRLVDMNVQPLKAADIEWADVVFCSAMLVQKDSLRRVVELCKAEGKRVVIGGPYVTTSAEHLPEAYSAMSVQYSRGCPFQCEFCDIIEIYGRVPRTKGNEQMLAELDALFRLGWRGMVFIVDDNFIGNKRNVKKLLPALADWSERHGRPFSFITEASVNLAEDEELLDGMRRANFRRVFLGIETPVEASLKEAQKGQNMRGNLLDSVRRIQNYGMEVMAGFIVGFDNDPDDIFERQIEFIRESAIPLAMVGLLTALPDTQLWRRLEREGRLLLESTGNNTDGSLNFVPKMDATRLIEGYKSLMRTIYSPGEYYQRALNCLERVVAGAPDARRNRVSSDLVTLSRIVLALGVRDRARGEFWRYLRCAITRHREKFAEAVRLAAVGYHFRKLTED